MPRERVISTFVVLVAAALAAWAIHADETWFMTHWMRHQCFLTRTSHDVALGVRAGAGVLSVLLVLVARRLARVSTPTYLRILLAVVLALGTTEIVLRTQRAKAAEPPADHRTVDATIGGRTVRYTFDPHGYRVADEKTSVDLHARSVVMSGESVAFGFGLDYEESIGARLEHRLGLQDVNMAVSGFSNASSLERLQAELPKLDAPVAVVCFVIHTWLDRNTDRRGWHVVWGEGQPMAILPPEPETSSPLLALFRGLFRYHDDHRLEIGRQVLGQMSDLIHSRNATPLFVFSQCGARCRSTEFVVSELTRDLDAPWISLDTPEEENLPSDMHPGPAAAARYADAIEKALRTNGVAP